MSDTSTTTPTVHTLYRPGDRVRFTFDAGNSTLDGTYEGTLSEPDRPDDRYLRVKSSDYSMHPVTAHGEPPRFHVVSPDGSSLAYGIKDLTLIERFGLPVWLLDKSREDHAALFAGYRTEVTHALVFTSTSTGSEVLTVPYTPSEEVEAGWKIGALDLTACGLSADHALLGEQGWWVNKGALREIGVKFPEDEPETPKIDPATLAVDVADLRTRLEAALANESHLRAEVERLTGDNRLLRQADQDLRRQVGTVAMRYAREHGWCDTVRDALSDMGIDPVDQKQEVWLTIRVRATGIASAVDPSLGWTRDSISVDESDIASAITFDGDWEDVEVDVMEFEVDSVDPLED